MHSPFIIDSHLKKVQNSYSQSATSDATKMKTSYLTANKNIYPIWRSKDGKYFIVDKNGKVSYFSNPNAIKLIDQNKRVSISKELYENMPTQQPDFTEPDAVQGSGGGGGGGYAAPYASYPDMSRYAAEIEALQRELAELKRPRSAKEIAEIYGLTDQYNEENILKDYNEATNQYYDTAVAEQNKLRTNYAKNNAAYVDRVADAYLDSYKNSAPTAVGRGTRAANTLSTLLQAEQTNASNDYGMMQSVNNLEEARKAELAANPDLARQYYNSMGTYLSTLSATLNQSDVKQYVDSLDAYASNYAADRSYQSYLAQANAAKYAGLANAALTNAQATSNSYNSAASAFERLWNYYNKVGGNNPDYASKYVAGLLKASQNKIE
jgi:hypothetical protein